LPSCFSRVEGGAGVVYIGDSATLIDERHPGVRIAPLVGYLSTLRCPEELLEDLYGLLESRQEGPGESPARPRERGEHRERHQT
jgi:hypothetical protein